MVICSKAAHLCTGQTHSYFRFAWLVSYRWVCSFIMTQTEYLLQFNAAFFMCIGNNICLVSFFFVGNSSSFKNRQRKTLFLITRQLFFINLTVCLLYFFWLICHFRFLRFVYWFWVKNKPLNWSSDKMANVGFSHLFWSIFFRLCMYVYLVYMQIGCMEHMSLVLCSSNTRSIQ